MLQNSVLHDLDKKERFRFEDVCSDLFQKLQTSKNKPKIGKVHKKKAEQEITEIFEEKKRQGLIGDSQRMAFAINISV